MGLVHGPGQESTDILVGNFFLHPIKFLLHRINFGHQISSTPHQFRTLLSGTH